jgi:hypothetical protein
MRPCGAVEVAGVSQSRTLINAPDGRARQTTPKTSGGRHVTQYTRGLAECIIGRLERCLLVPGLLAVPYLANRSGTRPY